jgi:hypothetical protein
MVGSLQINVFAIHYVDDDVNHIIGAVYARIYLNFVLSQANQA